MFTGELAVLKQSRHSPLLRYRKVHRHIHKTPLRYPEQLVTTELLISFLQTHVSTMSSQNAMGQQSSEAGRNWMTKIKPEQEALGMGNIWEKGRRNDQNAWTRICERRTSIEGQNMNVAKK
jgi:hypothetical protein